MPTVRIWDLPTRLFHWLLAVCVTGLIVSGNLGGNAMVWHFRLGYAVLSLLLFRLLWGFVGGHWSRWGQFAFGPRALMAYLRGSGTPQRWVGHNPIGSWSVLLMLLWLLLQVSTGLVSDDEIANAGPLTALVSGATVSAATAWHKGLGKLTLIVLVVVHVAAIVWYRLRRSEPLLPAMLHGDKVLAEPATASSDGWRPSLFALVLLLSCTAGVRWLIGLGEA